MSYPEKHRLERMPWKLPRVSGLNEQVSCQTLDESFASIDLPNLLNPALASAGTPGTRNSAFASLSSPPSSQHVRSKSAEIANFRTPPPSLTLPHITPLNLSSTFAAMPSFLEAPNSLGTPVATPLRDQERSMLSFSPDVDPVDRFSQQQASSPRSFADAGMFGALSTIPEQAKSIRDPSSVSRAYTAGTHPSQEEMQTLAMGKQSDEPKRMRNLTSTEEEEQEELDMSSQMISRPRSLTQSSRAGEDNEEASDQIFLEMTTPTLDTAFSGVLSITAAASAFKDDRNQYSVSPVMRDRNMEESSNRSRAGSQASNAPQSSLRHATSSDSLSSTSSSALLGGLRSAIHIMPHPPAPASFAEPQDQQVALSHDRNSAQRSFLPGGDKSLRSASLLGVVGAPARPDSFGGSTSLTISSFGNRMDKGNHLVNPTTTLGTISQRRKSPILLEEDYSSGAKVNGTSVMGLNATHSQRSEQKNTPEEAIARKSVEETANLHSVSGSLPIRLRALSQPGEKMLLLSSYDSEVPAVPARPPSADPGQQNNTDPNTAQDMPIQGTGLSNTSYLDRMDDSRSISPSSQDTYLARVDKDRTPSLAGTSFLFEPLTPASTMFSAQDQSLLGHGNLSFSSQQDYVNAPRNPFRKPFHFLRQLQLSIQSGGLVTPRLYIPKQMWTQSGIKLMHLETKVRMLNVLLNGLEAIEQSGDALLTGSLIVAFDAGTKFSKELDAFESMLEEVQLSLSKKLGFIDAPDGKKSGQVRHGLLFNTTSGSTLIQSCIRYSEFLYCLGLQVVPIDG